MRGKLYLVLNYLGLVSAGDCDTANVHDIHFQHMVERFQNQMVKLGDEGFYAGKSGSSNLIVCKRGRWTERMMVETVLSMLTLSIIQESDAAWLELFP